jgi:hypothetical protein
MIIKLIADCRGLGVIGDEKKVTDEVGSRLVCEGSAVVVDHEVPKRLKPDMKMEKSKDNAK